MGALPWSKMGFEGIEIAMKGASERMVQTCLHCRTRVKPFTDGMCPSCRHSIHDSAPSVDDPPQLGPFQFSLRKLLLWTAVWSAYLGFVRWMKMPLPGVVSMTICVALFLAARIRWGYKRGIQVGVHVMGALTAVCIGVILLSILIQSSGVFAVALVVLPLLCYFGFMFGFVAFIFVHLVVELVDWLDDLMKTEDAARAMSGEQNCG